MAGVVGATAICAESDISGDGERACAIQGGAVICWERGEDARPIAGMTGATALVCGDRLACAAVGHEVRCWSAPPEGATPDAETPATVLSLAPS